MSAGPAVRVDSLLKRYGDVTALERVTVEVQPGELFGFIGPDGAGKTTLFRILVTLLLPDGGRAEVLGLDPARDLWALRRRVGYMPGRFSLYPDLSVLENLRFFASVFGTRVEAEMETIAPIYDQLAPFADRRAGALSGGMKQKLALCCALVHRPEILFLDEPTTGVDAVSRREFWELLARLRATGLTTVVSTPYMDEASRCDRVALIQHGRLLAVDAPAAVTASFTRPLLGVRAGDRSRLLRLAREWPHADTVYPFGELLHVTDRRHDATAERSAAELVAHLRGAGLTDAVATPATPTIEDVFLERMGREATDAPRAGAAA